MSPKISDKAALKATGKSWNEWFAVLDREGARKLSHRDTAKLLLERGFIKNAWWAQTITVEYERYRGMRVVGQTKEAGFEIGVQKTMSISLEEAWRLLTEPPGLEIWLGKIPKLPNSTKDSFVTKEGTKGMLRTVNPKRRLRLTYHPRNLVKPSTLQISLVGKGKSTSIRFHQEKLSSTTEREDMRDHWKKVLKNLEKII